MRLWISHPSYPSSLSPLAYIPNVAGLQSSNGKVFIQHSALHSQSLNRLQQRVHMHAYALDPLLTKSNNEIQ
jgi:hypothetical protein